MLKLVKDTDNECQKMCFLKRRSTMNKEHLNYDNMNYTGTLSVQKTVSTWERKGKSKVRTSTYGG